MPCNPNMLALQAWGVFPNSCRRRRAALISAYGRSILFVILLICAVIVLPPLLPYGPTNREVFRQAFFGIGLWLGTAFCAAAPFLLENASSSGRVLRSNYHDYYLAGFSGDEMLRGLAAPQLRGIKLFAFVYPACMLAICFGVLINSSEPAFYFFSLFMLAPALFNLLQVSLFSLALWPRKIAREVKVMILCSMVFTSPVTVWILFLPISLHGGGSLEADVILIPIELFSMLVRFILIDIVWDQALDHLEMREDPWRDPVNPLPQPSWRDNIL